MTRKKSRRGEGQGISYRQDNRVAVQTQQPLGVRADSRILTIANLTDDEIAFLKVVVRNALEGYRAVHQA